MLDWIVALVLAHFTLKAAANHPAIAGFLIFLLLSFVFGPFALVIIFVGIALGLILPGTLDEDDL